MPVFFRHKLLFIHVPKCGGDTVSYALREAGDPPFLFVADGSVLVNGHTPQHMTLRELVSAGWAVPSGFRVAALVRHPIHRVESAFRYIQSFRKDLKAMAPNPSRFLDSFLSSDPEVFSRFDNHNLGLLDFISGRNGLVDPSIHVRPVQEMDLWMQELGLPKLSSDARRNVTQGTDQFEAFKAVDVQRVRTFYARDIAWFEARFPHCQAEVEA